MNNDWSDLIEKMRQGSVRALSRLVSRVENRDPGWMEAMQQIYPLSGQAAAHRDYRFTGSGEEHPDQRNGPGTGFQRIQGGDHRRGSFQSLSSAVPFWGIGSA